MDFYIFTYVKDSILCHLDILIKNELYIVDFIVGG
jgi:hypothetical protein